MMGRAYPFMDHGIYPSLVRFMLYHLASAEIPVQRDVWRGAYLWESLGYQS